MYAELCQAIVARYNLIPFNAGLLSATAPIYFGTAPDDKPYPFTNFWFTPSDVDFSFCSDLNNIPVQFSVFNNTKTPNSVLLLVDAIYAGFNDVVLLSLDGTQVRVDPVSTRIIELENDGGHMGVIEFKYVVEKTRA